MKKLLFLMLVVVLSLTLFGCEAETMTAKDLVYVDSINNEYTNTVLFKDKNGELIGFNTDASYKLLKGAKYDVEYTLSDGANYGDMIENIEESEGDN